MRFFLIAFACAVLPVNPAVARAYYYYKADVQRDIYRADREHCDRLMGGVQSSRQNLYIAQNPNLTAGQNAAVVGITSLFAGMMKSGERRRTANAVERTCMADKGYARYVAPSALAEEIEDIKDPENRLDRYFALATASSPQGERVVE